MARQPQKKEGKKPLKQKGLFEAKSNQGTPPRLPLAGDNSTFIAILQSFAHYAWDLFGVLLIAGSLILILGFLGITRGTAVDGVVLFLSRWFGWGRFLLAIIFLIIGAIVIRWRKYPPAKIALGQILNLELAGFVLLGIFSIISDSTVTEVQNGQSSGGIIGWGIAELCRTLLGRVGGSILLIMLFAVFSGYGFRLFGKLEAWVRETLSQEVYEIADESIVGLAGPSLVFDDTVVAKAQQSVKRETERVQPDLPHKFRKSLKPTIPTDEKPVKVTNRADSLPPISLLDVEKSYSPDQGTINMTAGLIEKTLSEFGIPAKVVGYRNGPTVTQYAVEPGYIDRNGSDQGHKVRISQISSLQKDLALALRAERLRIEAPVPGKSYVGVEVPNNKHVTVRLRPILESEAFMRVNSSLAIALGRDVSGKPVVSDLASMPHLLIAGTTNSGKSVCIGALTTCLVMNNTPEELRLVLIDPKMVELNRFNGLPHLLGQVETDVERIMAVLRWATSEMDYRYKLLEKVKARNLDSYNAKMARAGQAKLPKVVIMIDEMADLMMSAPDQTEHALVRLAQKSRAIGMHLVVATQRPSTDVVTGLIKANFPTRLAFTVASSVDSRVILDMNGAETLLGKGDMLFLHPESGIPQRAQGVMVTDRELDRIMKWWQKLPAESPIEEEVDSAPWEETVVSESNGNEDDALIDQAIEIFRKQKRASASYLQRQLRIGYPRAARLIEQLEEMGVLGPAQSGGKDREIFLDHEAEGD